VAVYVPLGDLTRLVKIGFLSGYEIDGNIVTVKRMFALPEK